MRIFANCTSLILATTLALCGHRAMAQGMGGIANQALAPLGVGSGAVPGWLYYGVNAADRGLGYNGSYMTLGGFVPYAEDDLGGLWAADVRGHLSEYGGFFSNVGAVRKQFIGGTLLGVGVYWDYDGDLNQYPVAGVPGAEFGQFGHVYNQVGISGEWLTDYGNLRSNGYVPVGSTAYAVGAPNYPFYGNYLLCDYGLDSALGGADLELGVYVPGLADWAGMVSVGGYALGNARYDWGQGPSLGQPVVPWFGGVYTRLDLTFAENWDFSLQYNNDSYFDSTGFARLTYRMGGSRRRNVPDQVEQPMMRNEHIVRAHQTPIVAINPVTNEPWRVIHVDNSALVAGNGTAAAPVQTLAQAQTRATNPYDVVFVRTGASRQTPYESAWQFQADNQILVGEGSSLMLATASCGDRTFFAGTGRPVLTSQGTAITLRNGAVVDHLRIDGAPVGILGNATLTTVANVNDVEILGTAGEGQQGISLNGMPSGRADFYNMTVRNNDVGLSITGTAADVRFQGLIEATGTAGQSVFIDGTTGGTIDVNRTLDTLLTPVASNDTLAQRTFAIIDRNSTATEVVAVTNTTNTVVNLGPTQITGPAGFGVLLEGNTGSTIDARGLAFSSGDADGIFVANNAGSTIALTGLVIDSAGATGVTVDGNTTSSISFTDLLVSAATDQAFLTQGNDAATTVAIAGASGLSSASGTLATFTANDAANLEIDLLSLESALPNAAGKAIVLNGTAAGFLTISDSFLVGGAAGDVPANVTNTTGVVVTVPAP